MEFWCGCIHLSELCPLGILTPIEIECSISTSKKIENNVHDVILVITQINKLKS